MKILSKDSKKIWSWWLRSKWWTSKNNLNCSCSNSNTRKSWWDPHKMVGLLLTTNEMSPMGESLLHLRENSPLDKAKKLLSLLRHKSCRFKSKNTHQARARDLRLPRVPIEMVSSTTLRKLMGLICKILKLIVRTRLQSQRGPLLWGRKSSHQAGMPSEKSEDIRRQQVMKTHIDLVQMHLEERRTLSQISSAIHRSWREKILWMQSNITIKKSTQEETVRMHPLLTLNTSHLVPRQQATQDTAISIRVPQADLNLATSALLNGSSLTTSTIIS